MKRLWILTILLMFVPDVSEAAPRIQHGDWNVQGALSFSHSSRKSVYSSLPDRNSAVVIGDAQYFFADRFSAGFELGYSNFGSGVVDRSLGPVFTQYFLVDENRAPYLSMLPIRWQKDSLASHTYTTTIRAGTKFFLTDSVAVGPVLEFDHQWGRKEVPEANTFSILGLFSIHL